MLKGERLTILIYSGYDLWFTKCCYMLLTDATSVFSFLEVFAVLQTLPRRGVCDADYTTVNCV